MYDIHIYANNFRCCCGKSFIEFRVQSKLIRARQRGATRVKSGDGVATLINSSLGQIIFEIF